MAAQNDLVLITGATGYLGYLVLLEALKAGYRVRLAIRSESKKAKVLSAPSLKALNPSESQISWVIVPDMAAEGAYDEAVKGVKYVIHVASPIPTFGGPNPPKAEEYHDYFVKPAIAGDVGMMKSAAKEPSVKRVVLTSSVVAITPFEYYMGKGDPDRVFTSADRIPFAEGPYGFEFEAYSAGKAAAINAAEKFVREEKPGFDLIPIFPGWIFGKNELITKAEEMKSESTNSVLLAYLTGLKNPIPYNGNVVRGEDCALVHVLALRPEVKGNHAFLATTDAIWSDAQKILKEKFGDAVKKGLLSLEGEQETIVVKMPGDEAERELGVKFAPFERMVEEVAGQYVELSA